MERAFLVLDQLRQDRFVARAAAKVGIDGVEQSFPVVHEDCVQGTQVFGAFLPRGIAVCPEPGLLALESLFEFRGNQDLGIYSVVRVMDPSSVSRPDTRLPGAKRLSRSRHWRQKDSFACVSSGQALRPGRRHRPSLGARSVHPQQGRARRRVSTPRPRRARVRKSCPDSGCPRDPEPA